MKSIKYIESVPCIMGNATGKVSIAEKIVLNGDASIKYIREELFKRNIITNDSTKWFDNDGEFYPITSK